MIRNQHHSRPEQRAGRLLVVLGVLSMATGLTFSSAAATGESTAATLTSPLSGSSTTFTWSYQFNAEDGHELSNIAISFCTADILSHVVSASPSGEAFLVGDVPGGHTGFGPGVKFGTTALTGTLTIVFDQAFPADGTIGVQSHSGDGQLGDQVTAASGPGPCGAPGSTTTTTIAPTTTTIAPTTTTIAPTTTTIAPTTTTIAPTTTTIAPTTTTVLVTIPVVVTTTTVRPTTTTTVRPTTTTTVPVTTTTSTSTTIPTNVLGIVLRNDPPAANLAGTGFDTAPLVAFGMICLVLGAGLIVSGMVRRADA